MLSALRLKEVLSPSLRDWLFLSVHNIYIKWFHLIFVVSGGNGQRNGCGQALRKSAAAPQGPLMLPQGIQGQPHKEAHASRCLDLPPRSQRASIPTAQQDNGDQNLHSSPAPTKNRRNPPDGKGIGGKRVAKQHGSVCT